MNATILPFPPQGDSPDLPSLEEMCDSLKKNYFKLDEMDRIWFTNLVKPCMQDRNSKIETIIECRAIAWSMIRRNGISL